MNSDEKKLLELYRGLNDADRKTLSSFLEFLASRSVNEKKIQDTPLNIPRPENETVIAAIKRLKKTYPMLESTELLNKTSEILTAHMMKGKGREEAITELETFFQNSFAELKS